MKTTEINNKEIDKMIKKYNKYKKVYKEVKYNYSYIYKEILNGKTNIKDTSNSVHHFLIASDCGRG